MQPVFPGPSLHQCETISFDSCKTQSHQILISAMEWSRGAEDFPWIHQQVFSNFGTTKIMQFCFMYSPFRYKITPSIELSPSRKKIHPFKDVLFVNAKITNRMSGHFCNSQYLPLWASVAPALFIYIWILEWKCFDILHESTAILNMMCFNYSLHSQRGCYQPWKNPDPIFELDTFRL